MTVPEPAEAIGYLIGAAIILALVAGSIYLIVNAESNIAAGAIGFGTAVLMNWLHRKCSVNHKEPSR